MLAALPVLVVLGLFAMHGLGGHGTNGYSGRADLTFNDADMQLAAAPHAPHSDAGSAHAAPQPATTVETANGCSCHGSDDGRTAALRDGSEHGAHSVAMGLCLALLVAVIAILMTGSTQRVWHLVRHRTDDPGRRFRPDVEHGREPDLIALGVCRC